MTWIEEKPPLQPEPELRPEPVQPKSLLWATSTPERGRFGWQIPDSIKRANAPGREAPSWYFTDDPLELGDSTADTSGMSPTTSVGDDTHMTIDPATPEPEVLPQPATAPAPAPCILVDSPGLELIRYDLVGGSELVLSKPTGVTLFGSCGEVELRIGRWGGSKLPGNEYFYVPAGMEFTIKSSEGGCVLMAMARDGASGTLGQQRGSLGGA